MTRWHAEFGWPAGAAEPVADLLIEVVDGRFGAVTVGVSPPPPDAVRLPGLTLPGLANTHSHAFHRALRGRTQGGPGDFWSWRDRMYAVADRLDPDSYLALARATYAEMALAGITCVGEFHYLHHAPGGTRYADPNAMGVALIEAAAQAGIRLTLLDTAYLTATVDGRPLTGPQLRFGDGDAAGWANRATALDRATTLHPAMALDPAAAPGRGTAPGWAAGRVRRGAAIHSVRAVPADQLAEVAGWAAERSAPLHLHLSEQPAENDACLAYHGKTPTALLAGAGVLGPATTAVHGTHLTGADLAALGRTGTGVCLCPTTERELADGIGPARALADAGSPLSLGTDSHAIIDMFEEARAVESHERLRTTRRGHFRPDELLRTATAAGHAALGWPDAGAIRPGDRADLVTIALDSARTAGVPPAGALFAATAADVTHVLVDGRPVVTAGRHLSIDVPAELRAAIAAVTDER
ncbi:formimidoylglutamate deiminase [Solwaraspora sp. WMMD1047]|uniref:formimidoylglutamate deiminase n=1 Tax=Solwaraspora sp. WMMD1047 TaxID=3016102 RepID=UPI002417DB4E|nr:formimidoylglutamate deiminase [Solwaraspora sp. WMMD1047]MDG4829207.1 formimidoylglutamate deiminase [Solwaraspora sp. WMMD1047]